MNYAEAVEYLQSFPDMERGTHGSRAPSMSLETMKSLLTALDNPQNGRHTIHVTGSKGKGSTSWMISSILTEAGFDTALYTSPHMHSYRERLAFNGVPVSEERFTRGLSDIREIVDQEIKNGAGPFSTFGILTALFFYLVSKSDPPIQWQIVEVGLGGRYDATNVFDTKDVAVITAISLEHTEILGSTQSEIAANKAGIITPGCFTVLGPQKDPAVRSAIGRKCHHVGAALVDVKRSYKIKSQKADLTGSIFSLEGMKGPQVFQTPMIGAHQIDNAATAAVCVMGMMERGVEITTQNIVDGLAKAKLEGRFELMSGRGTDRPDEPTIVLDGAHNHESAQALGMALRNMLGRPMCTFILGVNNDKNISAIYRELTSIAKNVITTRSTNLRAMDPQDIAEALDMQSKIDVVTTQNVGEAIDKALETAVKDDVICITGSLYLVAEAREYLNKTRLAKAEKIT
jgi:dihydrofolate synthase/folylpolyglutamate synthase